MPGMAAVQQLRNRALMHGGVLSEVERARGKRKQSSTRHPQCAPPLNHPRIVGDQRAVGTSRFGLILRRSCRVSLSTASAPPPRKPFGVPRAGIDAGDSQTIRLAARCVEVVGRSLPSVRTPGDIGQMRASNSSAPSACTPPDRTASSGSTAASTGRARRSAVTKGLPARSRRSSFPCGITRQSRKPRPRRY